MLLTGGGAETFAGVELLPPYLPPPEPPAPGTPPPLPQYPLL